MPNKLTKDEVKENVDSCLQKLKAQFPNKYISVCGNNGKRWDYNAKQEQWQLLQGFPPYSLPPPLPLLDNPLGGITHE